MNNGRPSAGTFMSRSVSLANPWCDHLQNLFVHMKPHLSGFRVTSDSGAAGRPANLSTKLLTLRSSTFLCAAVTLRARGNICRIRKFLLRQPPGSLVKTHVRLPAASRECQCALPCLPVRGYLPLVRSTSCLSEATYADCNYKPPPAANHSQPAANRESGRSVR